jgi:hypothetical protein
MKDYFLIECMLAIAFLIALVYAIGAPDLIGALVGNPYP